MIRLALALFLAGSSSARQHSPITEDLCQQMKAAFQSLGHRFDMAECLKGKSKVNGKILSFACDPAEHPPPAYIREAIKPLDFKPLLAGAWVVLIPEKHDIGSIKYSLIRYLRPLKEAGITHLAMEFLKSSARIEPQASASEIAEALIIKKSDPWPRKPYVDFIRAALREGIKVRGINVEEPAQALSPEYRSFEHPSNSNDGYMSRQILRIMAQEPGARILVLAGAAHLNYNYDDDNPVRSIPNTTVLGELWYQGLKRSEIKIYAVHTHDYPHRQGLRGLPRSQDWFLPLPIGPRPGCSSAEAHSTLNGIIYSID
ncbi:MAG: hypothetical protein HY549_11955 [Elusimicrobia bacterium]|nr:hypothetical protein [Elusimicrobiota bacterium]